MKVLFPALNLLFALYVLTSAKADVPGQGQSVGRQTSRPSLQDREEALLQKSLKNMKDYNERRHIPTPDPRDEEFPSDPSISVTLEQCSSFDTAFSTIAAQGDMALLIEGSPFYVTLPPDKKTELQTTLPLTKGNLGATLHCVASAYDYDTIRVNRHLTLLLKRYSSPMDFPGVSKQEAQLDMRAIAALIKPFHPQLPYPSAPDSPIVRLLAQMDAKYGAEQLTQGIPYSQFSPDDQELLIESVEDGYTLYISRCADAVNQATRNTSDAAAYFSDLLQIPDTNEKIFGFTQSFGPQSTITDFALSHGFRIQAGGGSALRLDNGKGMAATYHANFTKSSYILDWLRQEKSIHLIADAIKLEDKVNPVPSANTQNFSDFFGHLAARQDRGPLQISVNPALATKRVTSFHSDAASIPDILRGLATIYGLHVNHFTENRYDLTVRTPHAGSIEDLAPAVEQCYPEPWRRYFLGVCVSYQKSLLEEKKRDAVRDQTRFYPLIQIDINTSDAPAAAQEAIYSACARRLRALIEPKLAEFRNGKYPMSQMTDEESCIFDLLWQADCLKQVDDFLMKDSPRCLKDKSNFFFFGQLHRPGGTSILWMGYRDERGRLWGEYGADLATPHQYDAPRTPPGAPATN